MRFGQKNSSETFADFTLSRIPQEVRVSLTEKQYDAIRTSLIARNESARHAIDIRIRIPLFFRSYYVVLFSGRDLRGSTYYLEIDRLNKIPKPLRQVFNRLILFIFLSIIALIGFIAVYKIKTFLGIDIFPDFHLNSLFPMVGYQANGKLG